MELPTSLAAQLYLLTYDPEKERMARATFLGPGLRAAALFELLRDGRVADEGGKVAVRPEVRRRAGAPAAVGAGDPLLTRVAEQLEGSARPRSWAHWIGRDNRGSTLAVRDQLVAGGWLRLEQDVVLGIFPHTTARARDHRLVRGLLTEVRRALRGDTPVGQLPDQTRALAALAVAAELGPVANGREQRAYRERARALAEVLGPVDPALRRVIRIHKAASSSSG